MTYNTARTANSNTAGSTLWNDEEDRYWSSEYSKRSYFNASQDYKAYRGAYSYGYDLYGQNKGRRYDELNDSDLKAGWERFKDKTELTWERAKDAVKDAYNRVFDRDERDAKTMATRSGEVL